jgi:hypothetical protein
MMLLLLAAVLLLLLLAAAAATATAMQERVPVVNVPRDRLTRPHRRAMSLRLSRLWQQLHRVMRRRAGRPSGCRPACFSSSSACSSSSATTIPIPIPIPTVAGAVGCCNVGIEGGGP